MKALKIAAIAVVALMVAGALAFAPGIPAGWIIKPINDRRELSYRVSGRGSSARPG